MPEDEPAHPPLTIRTLGAVTAARGGREIPLGGPQPRLLLAFLVYARGREVGRSELLEALWGARPPARPEVGLRALGSKLRTALGVSLVEGHLPARVRIPGEVSVDVADMEAAVAAAEAALTGARPAEALERARAALALDRGPFAAGLEAEWLEEARRESRALRERALEVVAEAALAIGGDGGGGASEASGAVEARRRGIVAAGELCEAQPYREQPHLLLMRLLAAGGDRAQALAVYEALRRTLRDELGAIPGPELRALHGALLEDGAPDGDAAGAGPPARPSPAARPSAPFPAALAQPLAAGPPRGREEPLAEIERHRAAAARSGRLVLVSGEAGVGKTSVVAAVAAAAHAAGEAVLYGRCDPEPLHPFSPFIEALTPAAAAGRLAGLPAWARPYLALLLPGMDGEGDPGRDLAAATAGEGDLARLRMFAAVTAAIVSLRTGGAPVTIVLDDLHWADASSLLLLRHLVGEAPRLPLLVLGTMRDPDPDRGELLPATLTVLRRRAPLHAVRLAGLDPATVGDVISAWAGGAAAPPALAAELTARTRGNPFYLTAVLEHLRATRALVPGALPDRLPPEALQTAPDTVRDTVAATVARLGEPAAAVLDAAAILGPQFTADEVAAVCDMRLPSVLQTLEAAGAAGLTVELAGGDHAFAHALVRTALLDRIGPARRAHLHIRAGHAIEQESAAPERVGELARHFGNALTHDVAPRALRYARAAGDRAAARYAFAEAAGHYELALSALAATQDPPEAERYELLMALGLARYRSVGPGPAAECFARARTIAEAAQDPERAALAALGPGLERYLGTSGGVDVATVAALERAEAMLGEADTRLKARVWTQLLMERTFLDSLAQRRARSDRLTALAGRLGDAETRLEAFVARAVALWHPSETERLLSELPEMVALAERLDRPDVSLHLNCTAFGWALELGRRDELDRCLAAAGEAAERLRAPVHRLRVRALEITRRLLDGDLAGSRVHMAAVLPDARELFADVAAEVELVWSLVLAREQGGAEELLPILDGALAAAPAPALRAMAAEAHLLAGDRDGAARHFEVLAAESFDDIHEDFLTLGVLTLAGELAVALDDRPRGAAVAERLRPWADRNVILGLAAFHRPVALTLGALARPAGGEGDGERALALLAQARRGAEAMRAPGWLAEALYEEGLALADLGRGAEAAEALGRAAEIAEGYGGTVLAGRARRAAPVTV